MASQIPSVASLPIDEMMRDQVSGVAALVPDELHEVQHVIDRVAAAEELQEL